MAVWKGGDPAAGFRVEIDEAIGLVRLTFWGLWDDTLGAALRVQGGAAFRTLKPGYVVLADISNYPPQRPSVQAVHAELMSLGQKAGIARSANLVSSALSKLQIKRLSEESGLPEFSFFSDESAALAWLQKR